MSRWLITQDDVQFGVDDLAGLMALAREGKLKGGDMVQPPGATDWLYASEIPELGDVLTQDDDDDLDYKPRGGFLGSAATGVLAAVLLGITAVGGGAMYMFYQQLPQGEQHRIGDGITFAEMVVTAADAPLRAQAQADAPQTGAVAKDAVVDLVAKRGGFYHVRTPAGAEGWIAADHVLPMYLLAGGDVREELDPLYNPDRYIHVQNASWLQLDKKDEQKTVFNFMLQNQSRYPMTGVVLLATIKDSKGNELERVEIPVEGEIPPWKTSMVGTLAPDADDPEALAGSITSATYEQMAEKDPDLNLRYRDGVEVQMSATDFTEANIDVLEIRALAPEDRG